jgi:hypothetical protein
MPSRHRRFETRHNIATDGSGSCVIVSTDPEPNDATFAPPSVFLLSTPSGIVSVNDMLDVIPCSGLGAIEEKGCVRQRFIIKTFCVGGLLDY